MIVKLLKPLSFVPAILLMYMIFSFSEQDATTSSALSYQVSYTIVETANVVLDTDLQPSQMSTLAAKIEGPVRKLAHMTEYFALAIAVAFPLYVYGLHGIFLMLVAGLFCVAFAAGDEYHQSFIAGRSPSVRDVLIDSFGVFWGIILVRIVGWTGRKTIFRPFTKKKHKKQGGHADSPQYGNTQSYYPQNSSDFQGQQGYSQYSGGSQRQQGYSQYGGGCQGQQGYSQYGGGFQGQQGYSQYSGYQGQPSGSQYAGGPQEQNNASQKKKKARPSGSDSLSEDMSLKKLFQNLRSKNNS